MPTGKVVSVLAAGPLGPFADAYKERLTRRGYTPVATAKHVIHLGHLSRWLEVHGMGPADLTREQIGQFVAARQALVGHRGCSLQGLLPLLEILEERGIGAACSAAVSAAEGDRRLLRVLPGSRAWRPCVDSGCLRAAGPAVRRRLRARR